MGGGGGWGWQGTQIRIDVQCPESGIYTSYYKRNVGLDFSQILQTQSTRRSSSSSSQWVLYPLEVYTNAHFRLSCQELT